MSMLSTTARPYARAIFNIALENNELGRWSNMLTILAELSQAPGFSTLIHLPELSTESLANTILEIVGAHLDNQGKNLVQLLAQNKLLKLLNINTKLCMLYNRQL